MTNRKRKKMVKNKLKTITGNKREKYVIGDDDKKYLVVKSWKEAFSIKGPTAVYEQRLPRYNDIRI